MDMPQEECKVYAVLHEHLKTHFADDLKILLSTHAHLVTAVIFGFVLVVILTWRLLFGAG